MKLKQLNESDPRVGGAPSKEELLHTFIDRVRGMDRQTLVALIGELANELQDDEDFLQVVGQVLRTDEVHPPG